MRRRTGRCWKTSRAPDGAGLALLRDAANSMRLTVRGYHRVPRVARTLADLDGAEKVGRVHMADLPRSRRRSAVRGVKARHFRAI
jgi:predicted ATPase with chaperone activity